MASAGRRDAPALRDELFERTEAFEFEQAVRLLARLYPERAPLGGDADPGEEFVRFASDVSGVFPAADVRRAQPAQPGEPARLLVCFMGVATPASFGALPRRYAEEVRRLLREKNTALRDFFDLFNHRLISLFYRARERHRPALLFERGPDNPLERALAALLGIASPGLAQRLALPDRALFARAGLLGLRPMPALALGALVESVFGVSARILQLRRSRHRIEPEDRSRLGRANARLGADLVLGGEVTLLDSRFRVRIGPVTASQYAALLPDASAFRQLCDLVRFAVRAELDFDVQVLLAARDAPPLRLGGGAAAPSGRLGWSSWLPAPGRPGEQLLQDAIFTPPRAGSAAPALGGAA